MSYTMSAPLMQDLTKYKELLPSLWKLFSLNWEKFFDNPVRGDDVPSDVGPTIEDFWSKVSLLMSNTLSGLRSTLTGNGLTESVALQSILRFLIIGEYFYSNGSLMSTLGCHGAPYVEITRGSLTSKYSWDAFFDETISNLALYIKSFNLQDITNNSTYSVQWKTPMTILMV